MGAVTAAAAFIGGAISSAASAIGIGGFLSIASKIALTVASSFLQKKPDIPSVSSAAPQISREAKVTTRSPISTAYLCYGKCRKSGNIFFIESTSKNRNLYIGLLVASHEVHSLSKIYFDKVLSWSGSVVGRFVGNMSVESTKLGGSSNNTVSSLMSQAPSWSATHLGKGLFWVGFKLVADEDAFPSGLPQVIECEFLGRKILNLSTLVTEYSTNPAYILYDYLTDPYLGAGINDNFIDIDSFIAAAAVCDQPVDLAGGGTEPRYSFNGVIEVNNKFEDVVNDILTTMSGDLLQIGGKYILKAGAYTAPVAVIDEFLSPLKVRWSVNRVDRFTEVTGLYTDISTDYEAISYPTVSSAALETLYGESIQKDFDLPYVISPSQAQRLAKIALLKSQEAVTVSVDIPSKYLNITAGDTVAVTHEELGWSAKEFTVVSMGLSDITNDRIQVELVGTSSSIYDWDEGSEETASDPYVIPTLPTTADTLTDAFDFAIDSVEQFRAVDGTGSFSTTYTFKTKREALLSGFSLDTKTSTKVLARQSFVGFFGAGAWSKDYSTTTELAPGLSVINGSASDELEFTLTTEKLPLPSASEVVFSELATVDFYKRQTVKQTLSFTWGVQSGTEPIVPTAPTIGSASQRPDGNVVISWTRPADAYIKQYRVYEATVNTFASATLLGVVNADHYNRFTLESEFGVERFFWVKSEGFDGALSTESSSVSITPSRSRTRVYRQSTQPSTDLQEGDIWFDTDDDNKAYIYNGSTWDLSDSQIVASRIISGSIGAETIELDGASSILQSSNYVSNTSGWRILGDGNAEFNDMKIRGNYGLNHSSSTGAFFTWGAQGTDTSKIFNGVQTYSGRGEFTFKISSTAGATTSGLNTTWYGALSTSGSADINNRVNGAKKIQSLVCIRPLGINPSASNITYQEVLANLQYRINSGSWSNVTSGDLQSSITIAGGGRFGLKKNMLTTGENTPMFTIPVSWTSPLTSFTDSFDIRVLFTLSSTDYSGIGGDSEGGHWLCTLQHTIFNL